MVLGGVELTEQRFNDVKLLAGDLISPTLTFEQFRTLFDVAVPRTYPFVTENVTQVNGEHIGVEITGAADLLMTNFKEKCAEKLASAALLLKVVNQQGEGVVLGENGEVDDEQIAEDEFFDPGAEYWVLDGKSKPFAPDEWWEFTDGNLGGGRHAFNKEQTYLLRQLIAKRRRVRAQEFARSLTTANAPKENFIHYLFAGRPYFMRQWSVLMGWIFDFSPDASLFTRPSHPEHDPEERAQHILHDIAENTDADVRYQLVHRLFKPADRLPHLLPVFNYVNFLGSCGSNLQQYLIQENLWVVLSSIFDPAVGSGLRMQIKGDILNHTDLYGRTLVGQLSLELEERCSGRQFSFSVRERGGETFQYPLRWIVGDTRVTHVTLTKATRSSSIFGGLSDSFRSPLQIIEATIIECENFLPAKEVARPRGDEEEDSDGDYTVEYLEKRFEDNYQRKVREQGAFLAELKAVRSALVDAIQSRSGRVASGEEGESKVGMNH